jgi:hypothetical protein
LRTLKLAMDDTPPSLLALIADRHSQIKPLK